MGIGSGVQRIRDNRCIGTTKRTGGHTCSWKIGIVPPINYEIVGSKIRGNGNLDTKIVTLTRVDVRD